MRRAGAPGWTLSSSTGRESVSWAVRSIDRDQDDRTLVCDVTLDGRYYDGLLDSGAAEPDFSLVLRGLMLRAHELERLVDQLERGLALPSRELRSIALACSMGGLFDQSLHFELGTRDDTLAAGKPVATFRFVVGRMRGELSFPTDPGCLRRFADGIQARLRE